MTNRKRPPSTFRTTAGLIGLRSASMVTVPDTATKSFVSARASRMRFPSVDPARRMASARSFVASYDRAAIESGSAPYFFR